MSEYQDSVIAWSLKWTYLEAEEVEAVEDPDNDSSGSQNTAQSFRDTILNN